MLKFGKMVNQIVDVRRTNVLLTACKNKGNKAQGPKTNLWHQLYLLILRFYLYVNDCS